MNTYTCTPKSGGVTGWLARTEAWLDDKGKTGWIMALVVSMIVFWPIGLMLLAYMLWSNKLTRTSNGIAHQFAARTMRATSGNSAFDAYRDQTLRRLEEEQRNFESFLDRLRAARDKAEFDQFMDERARTADAADNDVSDSREPPRDS